MTRPRRSLSIRTTPARASRRTRLTSTARTSPRGGSIASAATRTASTGTTTASPASRRGMPGAAVDGCRSRATLAAPKRGPLTAAVKLTPSADLVHPVLLSCALLVAERGHFRKDLRRDLLASRGLFAVGKRLHGEVALNHCAVALVDIPCSGTVRPRCPQGARAFRCSFHGERRRSASSSPYSNQTFHAAGSGSRSTAIVARHRVDRGESGGPV